MYASAIVPSVPLRVRVWWGGLIPECSTNTGVESVRGWQISKGRAPSRGGQTGGESICHLSFQPPHPSPALLLPSPAHSGVRGQLLAPSPPHTLGVSVEGGGSLCVKAHRNDYMCIRLYISIETRRPPVVITKNLFILW